jgi:hypothetical protein
VHYPHTPLPYLNNFLFSFCTPFSLLLILPLPHFFVRHIVSLRLIIIWKANFNGRAGKVEVRLPKNRLW